MIELVDLQAKLLNFSALAYSYEVKTKSNRKRRLEIENGRRRIVKEESTGEPELLYQGAKATFVSAFDVYPDIFDSSSKDINEIDLYLKEVTSLSFLKNNKKYKPEAEYAYQDWIIYRGNEGLEELDSVSYKEKNSDKQLKTGINSSGEDSERKGDLEIRTAYLKEFCIVNNEEKEYHENVIVIYAKTDNNVIPLLIEYNHNDFIKKNILLIESQANPWGLYGESQKSLSYQQACWLNFLRACQTAVVGKNAWKTRFIPSQLKLAVMKLGISEQRLEEALRGAGYDIPYDADTYNQGANGIWSPDDSTQQRDLQAYDSEIVRVVNELNQINFDMQNTDAAASTATGVSYVQSKQTALYKRYLRNFADNIVKPFIELFIDDLCLNVFEELIEIDLSDERVEELGNDLEPLIQQFKITGELIQQSKQISPNQELLSVINPITKKEIYQLSQQVLAEFKANVEINIEGNDYDKTQSKADNLELMNLVQGMAEGGGKDQALTLTIEEYLELRKNKNKNKYMKILEVQAQEKEQQQALQAQEMANQTLQAEAKATKDQAQSEVMNANAMKTTQEVQDAELAKQMMGI